MSRKKMRFLRSAEVVVESLPDAVPRSSTRRVKNGRKSFRRNTAFACPESLEQRLALAVDFIAQPTLTLADGSTFPGWVTAVASNSDDMYLQQVATVPQSLLIANNSSFTSSGLPGTQGPRAVSDIDSYGTIFVTNGRVQSDANVPFDNAPMWGGNTTHYVLGSVPVIFTDRVRVAVQEEIYGKLSYTQADGIESTWTFTNWNGEDGFSSRFSGSEFEITSGPGYGGKETSLNGTSAPFGTFAPFQSASANYVIPKRVSFVNRTYTDSFGNPQVDVNRQSLEVEWSDSLTTNPSGSVTYYKTGLDIETNLLTPSASQAATFTLSSSAGLSNKGIVPGSLQGSLVQSTYDFAGRPIDNVIPFSSKGPYDTALVFPNDSIKQWSGRYDANTGVVSIQYAGIAVFSFGSDTVFFISPKDPGPLTLSASYAVYEQDTVPSSVVFFAGQDITRQVVVDLLTEGSTIRVDNQIKVGSLFGKTAAASTGGTTTTETIDLLASGDIQLNATNVELNAAVASRDRLTIGAAFDDVPQSRIAGTAPTVTAMRRASAIADVAFGRVTRITVPPGSLGLGYDPINLPAVKIGDPSSVAAILSPVVDGRVVSMTVTAGGTGYTQAPTVSLSAPQGSNGIQAKARAVLGPGGSVAGIVVEDPGSGYLAAPTVTITATGGTLAAPAAGTGATALATVAGPITRIDVLNAGFGYDESNPPAVTIGGGILNPANPAVAVAVVKDGRITRVDVTNSGGGYAPDSGTSVSVADPPPVAGTTAQARAILDADGRLTGIEVIDGGSGYGVRPAVTIDPPSVTRSSVPVKTQSVSFNASVAAGIYDVRVTNTIDITAAGQAKSSVLVTQTGSLQGLEGQSATSLFMQAQQGDVRIEGQVNAALQSYLMQSPQAASDFAPFVLTTQSRSGAPTGVVRGGAVSVTLGTDAPTPADDAVAFNICDLDTTISSFRIRAATRSGITVSDPFPYQLAIRETNDISFDAVAASSFPIELSAAGSMAFTSAISTAGDFIIFAADDVTVQAPLFTSRGRVVLNANGSVSVQNGLSVGDGAKTPLNAGRQDIVLNAQGGGISVAGLVSAPNGVALVQRNAMFAGARRKSAAPNRTLLPGATVTEAINVPDNFVFNDLNVELNITHALANLLSIALIAPDGTRVDLASFVGGRTGANFTNTVFDSEAATSINNAAAPFTGSFRPQQPLSSLYNRSAFGTWRLQVTNVRGFTEAGTTPVQGVFNNFTLAFAADANGVISGSGRVVADTLDIDAETAVGDAGQLPGDTSYFLRTDVNTLTARAGGSIAIDEANTIDVQQIRAGGIVTIRANGADREAATNAGWRPALKAVLTDVKAMDVSAPNGSIDINYNSPAIDVALGNAKNLSLSRAVRNGKVFSMLAGGGVSIRSTGGASLSEKLVVLDGPLAGSGARVVRVVTTTAINGTYDPKTPGVFASTIDARSNGSLSLPGVSNLRVGDRVLVGGGTNNAPGAASNANGVYLITNVGSASSKWKLVRAADSDTAAEMPTNTFVKVQDGTAAAKFFQVTFSNATTFARNPIRATDVTALLKTNIGSDDPSDIVQFVVSTPDGTNAAPGSLGKMINLRQSFDTSTSLTNPTQQSEFRFSTGIGGPIRLTQQLPVIVKGFTIDGNSRLTPSGATGTAAGKVVVDGSQISLTAGNTPVQAADRINGFEFRGTGAAGSVLSNLTASGFSKGAAVMVDGVPGMVITNVTLGLSDTNDRLQNDYGILIKGNSSNVQLKKVTVASSTVAGIAVLDSATGTTIVGSTIGVSQRDNGIGVLFDSTGVNSLGSVSEARNLVRFNQTGVWLRRGTNTVINTEISSNTFDGIRIDGGNNVVGTPAAKNAVGKLSGTSNAIYANGGWGINFISAAVAKMQRITGNYLGSGLFNAAPGKNVKGNAGVSGSGLAAESIGYKPDTKTGLDSNGNQHTNVKTAAVKPRVTAPWRPRR